MFKATYGVTPMEYVYDPFAFDQRRARSLAYAYADAMALTTSYWPADTSEEVRDTTVGGVLRAVAAASPDRTALVAGMPDPAQRRRWTYAELLVDAEHVARHC
jgi:hypothetical protein